MKLYEIQQDIDSLLQAAFAEAEENNGVISEQTAEALNEANIELDSKVESVALCIKNFAAEEKALQSEIKVLQQRKKAAGNRAEWLKKYLQSFLVTKFKTSKVSISFRKSESVNVENVDILDSEYKTISVSPDLIAIKKAIKSGAEVEGAEIVTNNNIVIR